MLARLEIGIGCGEARNCDQVASHGVSLVLERQVKTEKAAVNLAVCNCQIRRIHSENPLWSPERIHYQLVSLGIADAPCPNTIAKYIPTIRKPPSEKVYQSWRTVLSNHMHNTWAMDFFTVPSITCESACNYDPSEGITGVRR